MRERETGEGGRGRTGQKAEGSVLISEVSLFQGMEYTNSETYPSFQGVLIREVCPFITGDTS